MGVYSIARYKPFPGKEAELLEEVKNHLPVLRTEGLITDSASVVLRASEGSIIEIFEWSSHEAINAAHTNPQVLAMWDRFGKACEYLPLESLPEIHDMFPGFQKVEW